MTDWPAVWSITQVPKPDLAAARRINIASDKPFYQEMFPGKWTVVGSRWPSVFWLNAPSGTKAKIGLQADALAVLRDRVLFLQYHALTCSEKHDKPTDRAQVYAEEPSDSSGKQGNRYWELEFTSGGGGTERPSLTVIWELHILCPWRLREDMTNALFEMKTECVAASADENHSAD